MSAVRVGIIGASGYTGVELLRLCAQHPQFEVVYATGDTRAGTLASSLYPSLTAAFPDLVFEAFDEDRVAGLDLVFLGLPHEASLALAPRLVGRVGCVVDLSAAYRLKDASLYPTWYGFEHDQPDLLAAAVFGLPELTRPALRGARLVATPGCHVTAAALALEPLVAAGLVDPHGLVVDSITGVSGAGRALKDDSLFCAVDEDLRAYGLLDHRHTPEMEQAIGMSLHETTCRVLFTPHLAPLNRAMLVTCYAKPAKSVTTESLLATLASRYRGEPFVVVRPTSPSTKAALGTNTAFITARYDQRTDTVIAVCALDNLCKGASGGAVQSANVALGLDESAGLQKVGLYP
ncbi:MAG: N-acetyl-gamma-glutamyl-phosphate reductase [Actinomycetota bacterium]|jgi:N-acetyl-gamma-glutamyl-phosphate reductase